MSKWAGVAIRSVLIWLALILLSVLGYAIANLEFPTIDLTQWEPDARVSLYFSALLSIFFGWISQVISD